MSETLLFGPLSVDRYLDEQRDLPGGGALNMAYHWAQRGVPFRATPLVGRRLSSARWTKRPQLAG